MSVRPTEMAAQVTIEPFRRLHRSRCSKNFIGTFFSLVFSVPLLIWITTIIVRNVLQSAKEPFCDRLLRSDPTTEAVIAIVLITVFIAICAVIAVSLRDWYATAALSLVLLAILSLLLGFPNLEDKTSLHIFRDRPVAAMVGQNKSEYWKKTIKSCVCETEACVDYVYKNYMVNFYNLDKDKRVRCSTGLDYSGYKMSWSTEDEEKRFEPPKGNKNGTSVENEDVPSTISRKPYHEVCYSKSSGDKGIKTLCYSCYACEENRLRRKLRSRWTSCNKLFIMTMLLIATNLIVFLAESWARYMDT